MNGLNNSNRMKMKFKPIKKHIAIFERIHTKGKYKPTYSDQEPALKTLIKNGLVEWNAQFTGVVFTQNGREFFSEWTKQQTI